MTFESTKYFSRKKQLIKLMEESIKIGNASALADLLNNEAYIDKDDIISLLQMALQYENLQIIHLLSKEFNILKGEQLSATINLKLLAHIFNDAYLEGTQNLERYPFFVTIKYFNYLLKNYPETKSQKFFELQLKFEDLNDYQLIFKLLREGKTLEKFAKTMLQKINNLLPNESIIIPGGYNNDHSGHAMLYEFKRDQTGDLVFLIYNPSKLGKEVVITDKIRFSSIEGYKFKNYFLKQQQIPKESRIQEQGSQSPKQITDLQEFIEEIIRPRISVKEKPEIYTQNHVFTKIFPQAISKLQAEKFTPSPEQLLDAYSQTLTAGQISGTCAVKSLKVMIEAQLNDRKSYKNFMLYAKIFTLKNYIRKLQEQGLSEEPPGVENQVRLAIDNIIKSLANPKNEGCFSEKKNKKCLLS